MKKDINQSLTYADSCIPYQTAMLKEAKGTPGEYGARLAIASARLVEGQNAKAREEVERVTKALGDSIFTNYWSGLVAPLSYCYTGLGERQKAVECLEFLLSKNRVSPALIRIDPFYKELAGYPPFDSLVKESN